MKKPTYYLLFVLLISSCAQEDGSSDLNPNVVSSDASMPFNELLLVLNVKITDSTYLVVNSIDSVRIHINNYRWTMVNSETIDTSKIKKKVDGYKSYTNKKINYLVVAKQEVVKTDFITAGDYAKYLNARRELQAGEYICLIESFQIKYNDNTTIKYYPFEYRTFKVEKNMISAFGGEFEIKID